MRVTRTVSSASPLRPESRAPARATGVRIRSALAAAFAALLFGAPIAAVADELQDVSRLVASGDLDAAEVRADRYLAKTPKDAQMRFLKGVIVAQRGRRDDAVGIFTGLTQDYPELPEPYNNMAVIYAADGQYDKARGALETAIRVSPQYATAYENLGDVYAALAARAYQDSRRYDTGNAAALRKLDATRALLTVPAAPAGAAAAPAASAATTAAAATPAPTVTTSQRNVGLQSPAGPRVTVGGFGAVAPEIVVPLDAAAVPQGSNVVAIESPRAADDRDATSTLAGARTTVAADPVAPSAAVTAVTAAVRSWAQSRAVTADDLRIRIDGEVATARFRETATGRQAAATQRVLTLRSEGAGWTVTDARAGS